MENKNIDLANWIGVVKLQKVNWMQANPKQPDMNPMVIVEREGIIRAVLIARRLDKYEGLNVALAARRGFAADALTLICDAHVATAKSGDDKFMEKYKEPGSMQRACDEQGACKTREITDCMICTRVRASDGKTQHVTLPYFYDEKYGGEFHWLDDEICNMDESDSEVRLTGLIPESLKKIIREPTLLDIPELQRAAKILGIPLDDKERQLYHGGRAICRVLAEHGHLCMMLEERPDMEDVCHTESDSTKQTGTATSSGSRTHAGRSTGSTPSGSRGRSTKKQKSKRRKKR